MPHPHTRSHAQSNTQKYLRIRNLTMSDAVTGRCRRSRSLFTGVPKICVFNYSCDQHSVCGEHLTVRVSNTSATACSRCRKTAYKMELSPVSANGYIGNINTQMCRPTAKSEHELICFVYAYYYRRYYYACISRTCRMRQQIA